MLGSKLIHINKTHGSPIRITGSLCGETPVVPLPKGQPCRKRHNGACSFRYPREQWVILFAYRDYMCKGKITDQHYQIFHLIVTSKILILLPYWLTFCFVYELHFMNQHSHRNWLNNMFFNQCLWSNTVSHTHRITVCFFSISTANLLFNQIIVEAANRRNVKTLWNRSLQRMYLVQFGCKCVV